jgi:hypothetical protein
MKEWRIVRGPPAPARKSRAEILQMLHAQEEREEQEIDLPEELDTDDLD